MKQASAATYICLRQLSQGSSRCVLSDIGSELGKVALIIFDRMRRQLALRLQVRQIAGNVFVGAGHGCASVEQRLQPRTGNLADAGENVGCQISGKSLRVGRTQHQQPETAFRT